MRCDPESAVDDPGERAEEDARSGKTNVAIESVIAAMARMAMEMMVVDEWMRSSDGMDGMDEMDWMCN